MSAVLEIEALHIGFGPLEAVRGIDLRVERGQTHCLVGESGCGKSASALSVLRLLPKRARCSARRIAF